MQRPSIAAATAQRKRGADQVQRMAIIGLMSDSHGRACITQRAAEILVDGGAELLLHLGDIGGTDVIDAMLVACADTEQVVPTRIVFGNTDWDIPGLTNYARHLDVQVDHPLGRLNLGDKPLFFTHGHDASAFRQALAPSPAYVCYGHTHKAADSRRGSTRLINPGALFRTAQPTVALLDTQADELTFLKVSRT